jgi:hypothetical protein
MSSKKSKSKSKNAVAKSTGLARKGDTRIADYRPTADAKKFGGVSKKHVTKATSTHSSTAKTHEERRADRMRENGLSE